MEKPVIDPPILCPVCQVAIEIEPGGETEWCASCPVCKDYLYWIGSVIVCYGSGNIGYNLKAKDFKRLQRLLRQPLSPWAQEQIAARRTLFGDGA